MEPRGDQVEIQHSKPLCNIASLFKIIFLLFLELFCINTQWSLNQLFFVSLMNPDTCTSFVSRLFDAFHAGLHMHRFKCNYKGHGKFDVCFNQDQQIQLNLYLGRLHNRLSLKEKKNNMLLNGNQLYRFRFVSALILGQCSLVCQLFKGDQLVASELLGGEVTRLREKLFTFVLEQRGEAMIEMFASLKKVGLAFSRIHLQPMPQTIRLGLL